MIDLFYMKKEFWKDQFGTLFLWTFFTLISIALFAVGIVMSVIEIKTYWPILVSGMILLFICVYGIFFRKSTLSKIVFSEKEICIKRFNQISTIIKWSEVVQIKGFYYGRSATYMTFISHNNKIECIPTKKMYDYIISICPYERLVSQIENLEQFQYFLKKK